MGKGYRHGGGAGINPLNYKVAGNPQPVNPKENTIRVHTDIEIPFYAFSATEPAAPIAGMVWIRTGVSSPVAFNVLKKNQITVYPISAKQYVDGVWADVTAESYQNGEWVDWWDGEIYSPADLHESITGGWETNNGVRETVSIDSTGINFKRDTSGQSGLVASVNTKSKIDVTHYKSLTMFATWGAMSTSYVKIGLIDTPAAEPTFIAEAASDKTGEGAVVLDLSAIQGKYYVAVAYKAVSGTVTKVVLK